MWAAVYGSSDLSCMVSGILRGAVYAHLATIPSGLGAKKTPPMPHFSPGPVAILGVAHGILDLGLRVSRPGHRFPRLWRAC
jgi:hypothetical protein